MTDERLHLVHILDCIDRVRRYTAAGSEAYFSDEMVQDAVLRNLQILAESYTRLSPVLWERHPEIHWRGIAGFRNAIVHDYLGIDLEIVWRVIEVDLPPLAEVIGDERAAANPQPSAEHEEGTS